MINGKGDGVFEVIFNSGAKQSVDENALDIFLRMELFKIVFGGNFKDIDVFTDLFVVMFGGVGEFFFFAEEEDDNGIFFGEVFCGCKTVSSIIPLAGKNDNMFIFSVIFLFNGEMYLFAGVFH